MIHIFTSSFCFSTGGTTGMIKLLIDEALSVITQTFNFHLISITGVKCDKVLMKNISFMTYELVEVKKYWFVLCSWPAVDEKSCWSKNWIKIKLKSN